MKVMTISGFGGPEVFSRHDMPEPKAGEGQVVIDVRTSSVNPIDLKIRAGMVPPATPAFPAVLHGDVAGIVTEVGSGVDYLRVGDEVWGCAGGFNGLPSGALAEKMVTDAQLITKKPKNLSNQTTAFSAAAFLRTYGAQLAMDAAQARAAITNKLMEIADCGDPRYELKALELLGKHSDIGIFTERSEVTINYKNPEDLENAIKSRVKNLLNATVVETVPLDEQLGILEDETQARLDDALGVLEEDIEDVDVEPEDEELSVSV